MNNKDQKFLAYLAEYVADKIIVALWRINGDDAIHLDVAALKESAVNLVTKFNEQKLADWNDE